MIHAKIMIVDDLWCVVGSTNMDHRSFGWNDEVNLAAAGSRAGRQARRAILTEDLENSHRETLQEWENRSICRTRAWNGWAGSLRGNNNNQATVAFKIGRVQVCSGLDMSIEFRDGDIDPTTAAPGQSEGKRRYSCAGTLSRAALVRRNLHAGYHFLGADRPIWPHPEISSSIIHPSAHLNSREYLQQLEALSASRVEPHTHIEALPNGVNFYEAEIAAIQAAKQSVNWEAYIVAKGEIAKRIVDALTERARAGVEVNLNIDAIGSATMPKKFFNGLKQAGGHVEWYHPLRWYNWPRANNRTHRELIVIDGKVGFLGGAGISDQWWHGEKKDAPWRDTMFKITGDAVRSLQSTFVENWLESSGQILIGPKIFCFRRQ